MAVCRDCRLEMHGALSCVPVPLLTDSGIYQQIRYGDERGAARASSHATCGDCGVRRGGLHHRGCDLERCPRCGHQRLTCGCDGPDGGVEVDGSVESCSIYTVDRNNLRRYEHRHDNHEAYEDAYESASKYTETTIVDMSVSAEVAVALLCAAAESSTDELDLLRLRHVIEALAQNDTARICVIEPSSSTYYPGCYETPTRSYDQRWRRRWCQKREALERAVGGAEALDGLDAGTPLADEPFDWSAVPPDRVTLIAEVLAHADRCNDAMFDVEHRTACRRLLARVASGDASAFRRGYESGRLAAAVCWLVAKVNARFGPRGGLLVRDLLAQFEIAQKSVADIGSRLMRDGQFSHMISGEWSLASPAYLTVERRRQIVAERDSVQAKLVAA